MPTENKSKRSAVWGVAFVLIAAALIPNGIFFAIYVSLLELATAFAGQPVSYLGSTLLILFFFLVASYLFGSAGFRALQGTAASRYLKWGFVPLILIIGISEICLWIFLDWLL